MKKLYTANATAFDGRQGHAETDDKNLSVELGSPGGQSKKTGKVTNPEQLFACGYAACFGSALDAVAQKEGVAISNVEVHAEITLNQDDKGGYFLNAALSVVMPGVADETAQRLVEKAHHVCPYSKATRGNIEVTLKVNERDVKQAA